MVKLSGMLNRFFPVSVLLVGDFMLDTYTTGKIHRISPEAPVSVLHAQKQESRPGGAGNVALNLISLGARVITMGRIGNDLAGEELKDLLEAEGVDIQNLILQKGYKTPVKNRLIADSQQLLRVDFEMISPLPESLEEMLTQRLESLIESVHIVAVSDYGKGFVTRSLLKRLIEIAKNKNIPVIVDPKGEDFTKYSGATMIKPNLHEAYAAAKLPSDAALEKVAAKLLQSCDFEMLLVTRSEAGMSLFYKDGKLLHFPVRSKEVKDVTGAGDTVLSMISIALANKLDTAYCVELANIAAGKAIERLGCARISLSEIAECLLLQDIENKIFDEEHLFALQQALKGKRYNVLGIDSTQGMSTALFRALRKLSPPDTEKKLIVYVRDSDPDEEFVSLLSSLSEVDFIVLQCESLKNLCKIIHPHQVHVMENETLVALEHAKELLDVARRA